MAEPSSLSGTRAPYQSSERANRQTIPKRRPAHLTTMPEYLTANQPNMLTSESSHAPAYAWTLRVPSPPRIIVPPPPLDGKGMPDLTIERVPSHDFESSGFANVEFLRTVTYGDFMTANNMVDWKYEQRRTAQRVLPFLYLGPMSAARDKGFLQGEGITMVLAVRKTMSAQAKILGSKAASDLHIQVAAIDVAGNQELIAAFPRATELINSHLSTIYDRQQVENATRNQGIHQEGGTIPGKGKVLVFCESGNERAAAVVAAYMMAMYSMDLIKTIQIVQAQRFCISLDDSLKNLLRSYEIIIQAKRDVAASSVSWAPEGPLHKARTTTKTAPGGKSVKRTLDEAYSTDIEMGDGSEYMDNSRFEGREGEAPFLDVFAS
ncbi:MAG: hypothetical protein FRX48_06644 [Lasallia pustulata]|uniref:Tyrosine specific protein phosphatases domain-containing protein n=1 Tax=Lasallia pustulata TaxID=136370 RepID=A0A5M8PM36_9LECA|nr:MAG: hypothetical protein FRX48_06644 [Lasallia pustulata]